MDDFITIPFTIHGRRGREEEGIELTDVAAFHLTELIFTGLDAVSIHEHALLLKRHKPAPMTQRKVIKLRTTHEEKDRFDLFNNELQVMTGRRVAERLPVSALAVAISSFFGKFRDEIFDSGFLSFQELKEAVNRLEHVDALHQLESFHQVFAVDTIMTSRSNDHRPKDRPNVEFHRSSTGQARPKFDVNTTVEDSPVLSREEAHAQFSRIRKTLKDSLALLPAR